MKNSIASLCRSFIPCTPTRDVDTRFGDNIISIFPFLALKSLRTVYYSNGIFNFELCDSRENNKDKDNNHQPAKLDARLNAGAGGSKHLYDNGKRNSPEKTHQEDDYFNADKEIHATSKRDLSDNESSLAPAKSVWRRYAVLGPNIEHVVLFNYIISDNGSHIFFQHIDNLKTLHYQHENKKSQDENWTPNYFVQGVAAAISPSLEKFLILAELLQDNCLAIRSPLHGFTRL